MGIDLGTTFSVVGISTNWSDNVEIVQNSVGNKITPSRVGFAEDRRIIVGELASSQPVCIYDAKRLIGKPYSQVVREKLP